MFVKTILTYFLILFLFCNCKIDQYDKVSSSDFTLDSVEYFIDLSISESVNIDIKKNYLLKAYDTNNDKKNDSIKLRQLLKISWNSYNLNDTLLFVKSNHEAQTLATKVGDTLGIAKTHWYYGLYFGKKEILDSSYYHYHLASNLYKDIENNYYSALVTYNMAIILNDIKDYIGSEILAFEAVQIFEKYEKSQNIFLCYNLLGLVLGKLDQPDKAIEFHNKAFEYIDKVKPVMDYTETSYNNIGLLYQKIKEYDKSIESFKKGLQNNRLKKENINLYARLIDNLAYTRFLKGDTLNVKKTYEKALHIRDSIHYIGGLITSKLHLAEFFALKQDTLKAISLAKEANELALEKKAHVDVLKSYKLLAILDKKNGSRYFKKYASLTDSIQIKERRLRNKFTRIKYETDGYIKENSTQLKKIIILVALVIISVLLFFLFYFIKGKKEKNRLLVFELQQQKSNEEIYSLMLERHVKKEEGRLKERHRIAEELHDGILGSFYGIRMQLGFLPIEGDSKTLTKYKSSLNEMHTLEKEIRSVSHELKFDNEKVENNLLAILEDDLENYRSIFDIVYTLNTEEAIEWETISDIIKINLYRIIQEALQNIHKHARAKAVNIKFSTEKKLLILIVQDNGVGFDTKKIKKGIGLMNMRSRADKINGKIAFDSKQYVGTILKCTCPIKL